jgi:lysophospholipase L1-like esterase
MLRYLLLLLLLAGISCSPIRNYRQLPAVKSWEGDIRKFEHLDSTENYRADAILFAGSSSILLWSSLAHDMAPYPVIQRGYGGAKLSDLAVYVKRIIYPHPCRAIVMFVANDITGNKDDKSPEEVARLFSFILKTIRKKFPNTPVFWIATTPTPLRWAVWPQIREAGTLIMKSCDRDKNAHYITTDFAFLNSSGLPRENLFRPDRLHLNDEGYAVWTEVIKKELKKVLGD